MAPPHLTRQARAGHVTGCRSGGFGQFIYENCVGGIRSLARRRSVIAGAGVGSVVCIVVRQGSPAASVTCQVCACVVVSLLLLGCGLSVARPDCHVAACIVVSVFVLLSRPGLVMIVSLPRGSPVHVRMSGARAAWPMSGRAQAGLHGRGGVFGHVISAAWCCWRSCCCRDSRLSLQVVFAVCRMCSAFVGGFVDGVRIFIRVEVLGL